MDNMEQLNEFLLKVFTNFVVSRKNVISHTLNAPFEALERANDAIVSDGGR